MRKLKFEEFMPEFTLVAHVVAQVKIFVAFLGNFLAGGELVDHFYENTISTNLSNQIGANRRMYRPRKVKFDELKLNVDEHVDELEEY